MSNRGKMTYKSVTVQIYLLSILKFISVAV